MKLFLKIIFITVISLSVVSGIVYISVVGITWGLDIFKIRDLADFIGWEHIEYVTVDDKCIKLILHYSSYNTRENTQDFSKTEKIFSYLGEINSYINESEPYKNMKVTIQYGERPHDLIGLSNVLSFANHSLVGRERERYDGFYSVMCEMGTGISFEAFHKSPWNNVQEITYMSNFKPEDTQTIQKLTKLEYLYFHEGLDEEIYNELCKLAPWCEIEVG